MSDLLPYASGDGPLKGPDSPSPPRMPRWLKVSGIIAAVVVVAIVILALTGDHGPARHLPGGGNPGGHTPPVQHSQ